MGEPDQYQLMLLSTTKRKSQLASDTRKEEDGPRRGQYEVEHIRTPSRQAKLNDEKQRQNGVDNGHDSEWSNVEAHGGG